MNYQWKPGFHARAKAPEAFEELERIGQEHPSGVAQPEAIVEASRPKQAVLHNEFEWSNPKAAHEWRKHQARSLSNSLMVIEGEGATTVRAPAFVSVVVGEVRGYVPLVDALAAVDLRDQTIADGLAGLQSWKRRFGGIEAFAAIVKAIDDAA